MRPRLEKNWSQNGFILADLCCFVGWILELDDVQSSKYINSVIPAKAGIHHLQLNFTQAGLILIGQVMDSRLRGNDEA